MTSKTVFDSWEAWVEENVANGYQPYFMTVMFNPLSGNKDAKLGAMREEIERIYKTILLKVVRRPRSVYPSGTLPLLVAAPDLPVFKWKKEVHTDVRVNDGLHWHAIVLIPPKNRGFDFEKDLEKREKCYQGRCGAVSVIDLRRIDHDEGAVCDYALKSLKRGRFEMDELLILPRSRSEL